MRTSRKLIAALLLAFLVAPAPQVFADNRGADCDTRQNDDSCKREKPRFQTKFFSE